MARDHNQSNSLMHPRGENQAKDTGGGIGADRKHGGQ